MIRIKIKNAYELREADDGHRILTERQWPKSMDPNCNLIDEWIKELAPSLALEAWYSFDPDLWEGFQRKYLAELRNNKKVTHFVNSYKKSSTITLLFTASHKINNPTIILKQFLEYQFEDASK